MIGSRPKKPSGGRLRSRRFILWSLVAALVLSATAAIAIAISVGARPQISGTQLDQPVPDLALIDQHGRQVSLASLRGKVVVIYPFLTACHEVCPMTTGAFIQMSDAIRRVGLADRVALLEVSVDPGRDTPQRLAAYADLVSADWTMLTGTTDQLRRFWAFFGVYFSQTDIEQPAPIDWYTHQPETYDVTHTQALIFIDPQGHERIVLVGTADTGNALPSPLAAMLNDVGRSQLAHPQAPWTVQQALDNVGALLGRRIPAS
jgi:cytochrome oxidase Cu insertion factor (SCO1/SenC/PrrC family)